MNEVFLAAAPVLKRIEDAGYEAYFVGGAVRDYLLNRKISDVDMASSATPIEIKEIFSKTIDVGIEHGTVIVLYNHIPYEITTFRTESAYADFRRPEEVKFIRSLNEDLMRRDFTMNAIAMDRNGKINDPFQGEAAIHNKVIETVGQAEDRFSEDALRMLRAVRFMSQLSFTIEEKTYSALSLHAPLLKKIAVERKRAEFEKLLGGKSRVEALKVLLETEIVNFLPGLEKSEDKLPKIFSYSCEHLTVNEMWVLLLYCLENPEGSAENFLRTWSLPVKQIKEIEKILEYLYLRIERDWTLYDLYLAKQENISSTERLLSTLSEGKSNSWEEHWLNIYESLPLKERSQLVVTGNDLMAWFEQPGGPWVKDWIVKIEKAILEGQLINQMEDIKEWLTRCNQK
jgi:tRNA nucleotidyltransferase (CCA-adding enzyme)